MTDEEIKELSFRILGWALRHPFWGTLAAIGCVAYFAVVTYLFVTGW